jgi:DNA-binding transcriptional LysR family regulator
VGVVTGSVVMNFSFRHVEIFWAVMTTGSVTNGAALLKTSQPTVSRELARFEHLLEVKLFDRAQNRLTPTAEGLALYQEVKKAYQGLRGIDTAVSAIKSFKNGQISIVCLPAFAQSFLPYSCKKFLDSYSDVNISIKPHETPQLEASLSAQNYDFGLSESAEAPPGTEVGNLFTADEVCVIPIGHPLASLDVISPADLSGQNLVSFPSTDPYRVMLDNILLDAGISFRAVIETDSAAAVCSFVAHGLGVGIVNPLTALNFSGLGICVRKFSESIPFTINLVVPCHRPQSSISEKFISILKNSTAELQHDLNKLWGGRCVMV